ncbi:uncharacterized protein C8Q71DRAFT_825594 [Rhodofomes roseus]|uniref:Chromatin target of PRMT1 protein C-terminal domain-containing protein n=1 Tax=Rhodofomes roseus TaxID=34475 RepID=A0ABQ8KWJ8_9APHY|nr:uncharacterized protein C8Q71DRAFT_825594 [Rhodofomes roseus]KAH9843679.1 hypothetical protein C8Q71DRAFT_825594 [Rhodofomes roseus]
MDINPELAETGVETLSYDDITPYDQLPPPPPAEPGHAQLADRIGNTKVYLLSETAGTRLGKYRGNAILLKGTPISHLPTQSIFAYVSHFDSRPMALEWIDDTTCILVFPSKAAARSAHRLLTKSIAEEPSLEDGSVTAKPIPVTLWPPEDRINKSLGKGEGLKGVIRMRWATRQDVKKRGAKSESTFYKKYGDKAGKVGRGDEDETDRDDGRQRKRRRGGELEERIEKGKLDEELDSFLSREARPESPPSRMRSDRIRSNGKSLLERTSAAPTRSLADRIIADLPRRARSPRRDRRGGHEERTERERGTPRPRKTQEELDAELDAFLQSRG